MSDKFMRRCTDRLTERKTDRNDTGTKINLQAPIAEGINAVTNNSATKESIRILIAIRQSILRFGLASLLREQPEFIVVGTVGKCEDCHEAAPKLLPHVLLCDLESTNTHPDMASKSSGCPLEEEHDALPDIPTIVLQDDRSEHQILEATRIGIRGYLTTDTGLEDLFKAIRIVKNGGTFLERRVQSKVLGMLGQLNNGENIENEVLNEREQSILRLLAQGKRNQEIADTIFLSNSSVKRYVSSLCTKLGASNRAEAVRIGISRHLIPAK